MRVTLTHIHLNQARMNKCIFYTCAPLLSYYPKKNARLKGASSGAKEFEKSTFSCRSTALFVSCLSVKLAATGASSSGIDASSNG